MFARTNWEIPFILFLAATLYIGIWKHETVSRWAHKTFVIVVGTK